MVGDLNELDFRFERKFFISNILLAEIETQIKLHFLFFSEIYYERSVNNIYFDTLSFKDYYENIEGQADREKTRIRWYDELFNEVENPVLEFKIKKGLVGTKISYPLISFRMDSEFDRFKSETIFHNSDLPERVRLTLSCKTPVLLNRYKRRYFQSADQKYRITLDWDFEFYKIKRFNNSYSNYKKDGTNIIMELKYNKEFDSSVYDVTNAFPYRLTKSSKYVTGIDGVYSR